MRTYNSPEHESLRAVIRCLVLHWRDEGEAYVAGALTGMGVENIDALSPFGANFTRKLIEKHLPLRGDYC